MEQDYYRILGVDAKASARDIRRAWLKLARREHPDVNPGDRGAVARYTLIEEAWRVLSHRESRADYDRQGCRAAAPAPGRAHGGGATRGRSRLLSEVFPEAAAGEPGIGPARGDDIHKVAEVTFEEGLRGAVRACTYQRERACPDCGGRGWDAAAAVAPCGACDGAGVVEVPHGLWSVRRICPSCAGRGETGSLACPTCRARGAVPAAERHAVRVPAGTASGTRVVVAGAGQPGRRGGSPGDLVVTVRVHPHPLLERRGRNLYCTVEIPLAQAVLGGPVAVPTAEGSRTLRLPPGTQCGQEFTLRGRGVPVPGGTRGDLVVMVAVRIPSGDDPRVRRAMLALRPALPGPARASR